ncbi:MAG: 5/3-nucleotidase SurE [Bacilli bacterium]|nr:5/3-nucleotidase SurE [Bacilli bacterium]
MRILLVNDDGIRAEGIQVLALRLREIGKVIVAAPDRPRSAASRGITLHKPLHINNYNMGKSIDAYSVSGTPVDCVKIGISVLTAGKPDLIVSGINAGSNVGSEILYSGTVSAAAEGMIHEIPSIAVSACGSEPYDYEEAASFIARIAPQVTGSGLPRGTLLNVNVPPGTPRGAKLTTIGFKQFESRYEERHDPRGKPYYWLAGGLLPFENPEGVDVQAVETGYISVTPVHFDLNDLAAKAKLEQWEIFQ